MEEQEFLELTADVRRQLEAYQQCSAVPAAYVHVSRVEQKAKAATIVKLDNMVTECTRTFYLMVAKQELTTLVSTPPGAGPGARSLEPLFFQSVRRNTNAPEQRRKSDNCVDQRDSSPGSPPSPSSVQLYTAAQSRRKENAALMKETVKHMQLSKIRNRMKFVAWRLEELKPRAKTADELASENMEAFLKAVKAEKHRGTLVEFATKFMS